jgi:3-oxoacyl-[acyl-carrier protein] reductase
MSSGVNKAAIITGGGTGVGRATVLALARLGYATLVNYSRSQEEAEATCREADALGPPSLAFRADVADDAQCRAMVAAAADRFGRCDVLVNNAGITRFINMPDLEEVSDDDWRRIMAVNVLGPFHCARAVKNLMLAGGGGQIINVSSIAAMTGRGSSIPYVASKAALNTLTMSLARTLAPRIRVNAVAPGFITGRWLEQGYGDSYDMVRRAVEKKNPLGRVCDPDDVAAAIVGLVTGSTMITGQILVVDGGSLLGL